MYVIKRDSLETTPIIKISTEISSVGSKVQNFNSLGFKDNLLFASGSLASGTGGWLLKNNKFMNMSNIGDLKYEDKDVKFVLGNYNAELFGTSIAIGPEDSITNTVVSITATEKKILYDELDYSWAGPLANLYQPIDQYFVYESPHNEFIEPKIVCSLNSSISIDYTL